MKITLELEYEIDGQEPDRQDVIDILSTTLTRCLLSEEDREAYLDAWENVNDADGIATKKETTDFLKQLRAYRLRRRGKTKRDLLDESPSKPVLPNTHAETGPRQDVAPNRPIA